MPLKILHFSRSMVLPLAVLSASAQAATWDATADFTPITLGNPNGVWSYGYDPASIAGYQLRLFNAYDTNSGQLAWRDSTYQTLFTPAFAKNVSSSVINNGWLPGQIAVHPGPSANGDAAIVRFTAPSAGLYSVSAQFFAGDTGETDAWVVRNGNFGSPLATLGITSLNPVFSVPAIQLVAGETVDFVVGNNGSFFSDTTPLSIQISTVPEASTLALFIIGLAGLVVAKRAA